MHSLYFVHTDSPGQYVPERNVMKSRLSSHSEHWYRALATADQNWARCSHCNFHALVRVFCMTQ